MKFRFYFCALFFLLTFYAVSAIGGTITTVTVHEKAGVTTTNYPITFAIPFAKGAVTAGVKVVHQGSDLPTQFDIKRTWADGSVKHGIISVVIPQVDANSTETLTIETAASNSTSAALDSTAILATDVESSISLTNLSGSNNPTSASASLRTAIGVGNLEYWMRGSICTEILEDVSLTPNDNLHARWEARFYPGTSFGVRISNIVESVNLSALGSASYDVTIHQGNSSPTQVYNFTNYDHAYGSRWRKTFWMGSEPPEIELHYDTDYLVSTKMIVPIDTSVTPSSNYLSNMTSVFNTKQSVGTTYPLGIRGGSDIDGSGNIYRPFPMVGGRDELGIYPSWSTMYLLTYSNEAKKLLLGNGDIVGQVGSAHYREGDVTKTFFQQAAVSIDDRPTIRLWTHQNGPAAIGDNADNPNDWNPDRAHCGSFVYLPYLLTGEHYYMEELSFWASFDIGYEPYGRQGVGVNQDFSSSFPDGTSAGIIYDEMRAVAWSTRNISDAVNILPDSKSATATYFKTKLNNNFDWLYLGNTNTSHGLHILRVPRELKWNNNPNYKYLVASWMHDFTIVILNDVIRKEESVDNLANLVALRDRLGSFTIGRFTNHPDFDKWDGAGYWWPLRRPDADYFTSGSWSEYWTHFVAHNTEDTAHHQKGVPHSDFVRYTGDGQSYLYIAKAALASLTHLTNGPEAYAFVSSELVSSEVSQSPQWGALIPDTGYNPPTCNETAGMCTNQSTCETAGWNWCTDSCQTATCPTCSTTASLCADQTTCETSGWYWYNSQCNTNAETASCPTTPSLCNETECGTNGLNWCTDTCQSAACITDKESPVISTGYVLKKKISP